MFRQTPIKSRWDMFLIPVRKRKEQPKTSLICPATLTSPAKKPKESPISSPIKCKMSLLHLEKITEKKIWEEFAGASEEKTFLHSWNWGNFCQKMGQKIWRLGVLERQKILSIALITKIKAKRGTFLFCPHGPLISKEKGARKSEILKTLLSFLKGLAKDEKASFIRISPIFERNEENRILFKNLGFKEAPLHMHAEETWELNLEKEEKKILEGMRKTTRYLVRKGINNKDLTLRKSDGPEDLKIFNELYKNTVLRQDFVPFSQEYLENELLAFREDKEILTFNSFYQNEPLASAIIIFWQDAAFYHHGASLNKNSKIPASYFLQWEIIKEAKKRGCKTYNFWGVAPKESKNHPWEGLTLFKKGFGGYDRELVKTQDFPLSFKYWFNYFIETQRKKKRRL